MVGTSGALRSIVRDPAVPLLPGLFAQRFGPGGVVGGQLSEGGGTIRWISDLLGSSESTLERAAAGIPADGHGLTGVVADDPRYPEQSGVKHEDVVSFATRHIFCVLHPELVQRKRRPAR